MVINTDEGARSFSQITQVVNLVSLVILDHQMPLAYSTLSGRNYIFILYYIIIKILSGRLIEFK